MLNEEPFSRLDLAFAEFLTSRATVDSKSRQQLKNLLAKLSQQQHQGHSCIMVDEIEIALLNGSGLCKVTASSNDPIAPLILEDNRLYLQRNWFYENRLASQLKALSIKFSPVADLERRVANFFDSLTPENAGQRLAVKTAVEKNLCIITGGPGTGKTTTVCKILALLQELAAEPLLIALAAPTGKAAKHLEISIAKFSDGQGSAPLKQNIPGSATTLHRLLGAQPPSPYFRHNAENPLIHDVVIVDEASMVDLALMSKLVDALNPEARLILLGDKDQLVSVESGSVLADLIDALPANTVELTHAYRFESHIKELAAAVNRQDVLTAWSMANSAENADTVGILPRESLFDYLVVKRQAYFDLVSQGAEIEHIFQTYQQFQILCANRHGPFGAQGICAMLENRLFRHSAGANAHQWYPGRAVMILQNSPALDLYNGDVGICLPDAPFSESLMVCFQHSDGVIKKYLPSRLPPCETAFALTVHKSQGSEFEEVVIVLPADFNPVLSKELLYTAITRAKRSVKIIAELDIFQSTIAHRTLRQTGLADKVKK